MFATEDLLFNTKVCKYNGTLLDKTEADLLESDYLMEVLGEGNEPFFLEYSKETQETIGKFINNSKPHPNLKFKIFEKEKCVWFVTNREVPKGEELTYYYGPWFKVDDCTSSCRRCSKFLLL